MCSGIPAKQSFEIPDIPVRWYTFKERPVKSPSALDLELPEEAGGDPRPDDAEGGGDKDEGDDEAVEDVPEEVLPRPSALKAVYARGGGENFLLAMGGWARGAIFECSWEVIIVALGPLRVLTCVASELVSPINTAAVPILKRLTYRHRQSVSKCFFVSR